MTLDNLIKKPIIVASLPKGEGVRMVENFLEKKLKEDPTYTFSTDQLREDIGMTTSSSCYTAIQKLLSDGIIKFKKNVDKAKVFEFTVQPAQASSTLSADDILTKAGQVQVTHAITHTNDYSKILNKNSTVDQLLIYASQLQNMSKALQAISNDYTNKHNEVSLKNATSQQLVDELATRKL